MSPTQIAAFRIADLAAAEAFYCEGLGFRRDWVWRHEPGFPAFAAVSREGHTLYLTQHPECEPGGLTYLFVDDVYAWDSSIRARGVVPEFGPVDQPWGLREIQVVDPDGNKLRIVQRLETE